MRQGATVNLSTTIFIPRRPTVPLRFLLVVRQSSSWTSNEFNFSNGFSSSIDSKPPIQGPLASASSPKLTPRTLKQHLDRFVVGQQRSKRILSSAIYHHYRRVRQVRQQQEEQDDLDRVASVFYAGDSALHTSPKPSAGLDSSGEEEPSAQAQPQRPSKSVDDEFSPVFDKTPLAIDKSNILCLGPTGVGKTLMLKTLARVLKVPFSISDCNAFTQAGYVGEDVELCIHRLLAASNWDVRRAETGIVCLDEFDKLAKPRVSNGNKDISGEGVQQALLKIIEGTTVTISVKPDRKTPQGLPNNPSAPPAGPGGNAKGENFTVDTSNILFIFTGAFTDIQKSIMERVAKGSIGFNANVGDHGSFSDANFIKNHTPYFVSQDTISSEARAQTLPSKTLSKNFNVLELTEPADLISFGLIPEIVGRIPVIAAVEPLTVDLLVQVLTEPRNSLVKQYEQLFSLSGVELRFTTPALKEIARTAESMHTGARGLRTVMERLLTDAMFEAPGSSVKFVLVNEKAARREAAPLYYSRGQVHIFQAALASEEEEYAKLHGDRGAQAVSYSEADGMKATGFA